MKKRVLTVLLVLAMTFGLCAVSAGATAPTDADGRKVYSEMYFKYVLTADEEAVIITEFFGTSAETRTEVVVPRMIAMRPVNYIEKGAFIGAGVGTLWLPDCLDMSDKEIKNGDYVDESTTIKYYSGDPKNKKEVDASVMTSITNRVDPTAETKAPVAEKRCGDFIFTDYGTYAVITGYTGTGSVVRIPSTLDGIPVKSVEDGTFSLQKYDEIYVPSGVETGFLNARKAILNYDSEHPIISEEKEYAVDENGETYSIPEVIEIDEEKLTVAPSGDPSESAEEDESNKHSEDASQSGEDETCETDGNGNAIIPEKKDAGNLWLWLLGGVGGAAVLAGGIVMALSAKKNKER